MSSQRPTILIQPTDDTVPVHVPPTTHEDNPFSSVEGSPRRSDPEIKGTTGQTPPPANVHEAPPTTGRPDEGSSDSHLKESRQYNPNQEFRASYASPMRSPRFPEAHLPEGRPPKQRRYTRETHTSIYTNPKFRYDSSFVHVDPVPPPSTLEDRLQPTIDSANEAKKQFARTAMWNTWVLNAAIGLQVLLGSLTTGLSAVAATRGKSSAVQTTILGALSTIVASYLAKARGSNEPDFSNTRVKDLEQFLRDCDAFVRDHGHVVTEKVDDELNKELITKRKRLEEILGNINPPDNKKSQTTTSGNKSGSPA